MTLGEFMSQLQIIRAQHGDNLEVLIPGGIGHPVAEVLPSYPDGLDGAPVKVVVIKSDLGQVQQ